MGTKGLSQRLRISEEEKDLLHSNLQQHVTVSEDTAKGLSARLRIVEEEKGMLSERLEQAEAKLRVATIAEDTIKQSEAEKKAFAEQLQAMDERNKVLESYNAKEAEEKLQNEKETLVEKLGIAEGQNIILSGKVRAAEEENKVLEERAAVAERQLAGSGDGEAFAKMASPPSPGPKITPANPPEVNTHLLSSIVASTYA